MTDCPKLISQFCCVFKKFCWERFFWNVVGRICEEIIDAGWVAENKVVCIVSGRCM